MIETDKMPIGGKLTAAEKQLIRTYIEQGRFPQQEMEAAQQARGKRPRLRRKLATGGRSGNPSNSPFRP